MADGADRPFLRVHGDPDGDRLPRDDETALGERLDRGAHANFGAVRRGQLRRPLRVRGVRDVGHRVLYRRRIFRRAQTQKDARRARDFHFFLFSRRDFFLLFMPNPVAVNAEKKALFLSI